MIKGLVIDNGILTLNLDMRPSFRASTIHKKPEMTSMTDFLKTGEYSSKCIINGESYPLIRGSRYILYVFDHGEYRQLYYLHDTKVPNDWGVVSTSYWGVDGISNDKDYLPDAITGWSLDDREVILALGEMPDTLEQYVEDVNWVDKEDNWSIDYNGNIFYWADATISIICLARFFNNGTLYLQDLKDRIDDILTGTLLIVDTTKDKVRWICNTEELTRYKNGKKKIPTGYTLVGDGLHKPGCVLICDSVNRLNYLFGQDEDAYFGVELEDMVDSVADALFSLIPSEAKNDNGKLIGGILRHGEWFIIPVVDKSLILMLNNKSSNFRYLTVNDGSVVLPKETEESAKHTVTGQQTVIDSKTGNLYSRDFKISHSTDDHEDIVISNGKWYVFKKNTAICSFSVAGVD